MNPAAPAFATGTRVAGAVLILGYISGIVPGAIVSVVGAFALMTFGRALLLDRTATAVSAVALAVAAGAFGIAGLRWGTLSLPELVGAQSVLGSTILVGPTLPATASVLALVATLIAATAWATEPRGGQRIERVWGHIEAILVVLAAAVVFAAPGSGGGLGELLGSPEVGVTAGVVVVGTASVFFGPRLFASRKVRWIALVAAAVAVVGAASLVAGSV